MPHAIMFLPTESLYAEVVRRPGLQSEIQSSCRVTIAGPSTFMAILTSFQMGFHTLAIQKKGDEVWRVLSSAKNEFETYGGLMEKVEDQVGTVQNTIQKLGVRTRAINRALKNVSSIDTGASVSNLIGFDDIAGSRPASSRLQRRGVKTLHFLTHTDPPLCFTLTEALSMLEIGPVERICDRSKRHLDLIPEVKQENEMAAVDEKVKQIIVEQLQVDEAEVTPGASFQEDLGADSLDVVELVMQFEEAFDIQIPDEDAEKIKTVKDAVDYIEKNQKAK